ncbi:MAG TPA: FG-GAP-like repeat-containing protein [Gammaproteobacteria bacterium]|nr:FG-GAP-like repeat-containing protein [Gammaproteobacteria bacterium]
MRKNPMKQKVRVEQNYSVREPIAGPREVLAAQSRTRPRRLRTLQYGGAAIGLTVLAGAIYAATAGLPFSETFDDSSLSDTAPGKTTADWGATTAGQLALPLAVPLTNTFSATSAPTNIVELDPQITRSVKLADMNGDGFLDLIEGVDGADAVYLNDGAGNFAARSPITTDLTNTRGIAIGDVNGDGFLDIVVGNFNDASSRLYTNSGDGVTYTSSDITPARRTTDSIVLADLNNDGHLDVAMATNGKYRQRIYLNTGDPAAPFGSAGLTGQEVSVQAWDAQEVLAGDLNNDGNVDLVFMNANQTNVDCLNDGNAHFTCHMIGADADNSESGALADLNGDGFLDVVAGNYGSPATPQSVKVYLNTTNPADPFDSATAAYATDANNPTGVHRVAVADLDNDGDLDIILSTAGMTSPDDAPATTNRVLFNDGTGTAFTMVDLGAETDVTNSIAVGDVNGDGNLDIITGNESRDAAGAAGAAVDRLYLNTGSAAASAPVRQLRARAQSLRVDTATSNIGSIAMTIAPAALGADNHADFWVSSNGGAKWLHIEPNGTPLAIPDAMQGQDLRWRADLSSLSPAPVQPFSIDTLNLTADAPSITSAPVTSVTAGSAYEYDIAASDPNGDALTLSAPRVPSWLTFADNGGGAATLTGTPTADNAGPSTVELDVSDGTNTAKQTFVVTVANPAAADNPPSFSSTPIASATVGTPYSYSIAAADPDAGDTVALTEAMAQPLPAWLTLTDNGDGTGTLAGTPAAGDVGDVPIELTATDGSGSAATQDFTITVATTPPPSDGGGSTPPPSDGGSTPPPSDGGSTPPPSGGGSSTNPPASHSSGGGGGSAGFVELGGLLLLSVFGARRRRHPADDDKEQG